MERILIIGFSGKGVPKKPLLEAVGAGVELARRVSGELTVGLIGDDVEEVRQRLAGCGAARVLAITGDRFAQSRYATDSAAMELLCRNIEPSLILGVGDSRLSRSFSGAAHRYGAPVDTHICEWKVDGSDLLLTRWYYRQRMKGIISRGERPWAFALDPGVSSPWLSEGEAPEIEVLEVGPAESAVRTRVVEIKEPPAAEQTIRPDADFLFVAGAGWTKKQADGQTHVEEAERLILGFLQQTQASLGGSKSMVDLSTEGQSVLSFMTHLNQIGQTGSSPRHKKGLATCCHGEEPHAVGWRFIGERRAINTDPNCGWAQGKADVLYVSDAFAVISRVNEILGQG